MKSYFNETKTLEFNSYKNGIVRIGMYTTQGDYQGFKDLEAADIYKLAQWLAEKQHQDHDEALCAIVDHDKARKIFDIE